MPAPAMYLDLLADCAARAAPLRPCMRLPGVAALDAGRAAHHQHQHQQQRQRHPYKHQCAISSQPAQLALAPLCPVLVQPQAHALTPISARFKQAQPPAVTSAQATFTQAPLQVTGRMLCGSRRVLTEPSTRTLSLNTMNGLFTRPIPTYMRNVKLERAMLKPNVSSNTSAPGCGYLYKTGEMIINETRAPIVRGRARTLSLAPAPLNGGVIGGGRVYKRTSTNGGNVEYVCKVIGCGKRFARAYGLRMHGRKHTNESPYVCRVNGCGERFKWRSSLRHHSRTRHKSNSNASGSVSGSTSASVKL